MNISALLQEGKQEEALALSQDVYSNITATDLSTIVSTESCTIHELVRKYGDRSVTAIVIAGIADMLEFVNVQSSMNPNQISRTAQFMVESYDDMTLPSIKLFLKQIMHGKYKIYNKIDGTDILSWFKDFYQEYWSEHQRQKIDENSKHKGDTESIIQREDIVDIDTNEDAQRIINNLRGKGRYTDAELKLAERAKDIRFEVIKKTSHYYSEMTPQEAEKKIKEAIHKALAMENLEKYETIK